jgi:hypothetical protein
LNKNYEIHQIYSKIEELNKNSKETINLEEKLNPIDAVVTAAIKENM